MTDCCEHRCHLEPLEPKKPLPLKPILGVLFVAALLAGGALWLEQKNTHDERMAAIQTGHFQPPLSMDAGLAILAATTGGGILLVGLFGGAAMFFNTGKKCKHELPK